MVTGTVAANTAIGRLDASMLDIATTSSITNSMKVVVLSSPPTRCTRLSIQARPNRRSSRMKRMRQRAQVVAAGRLGQEPAALAG